MIKEAVRKLVEGRGLSPSEAEAAMEEIMSGKATQAQIGAFLTALRMKGETVSEIVAFAKVMRKLCRRISPRVRGRLLDTCGTGGDKIKTFNVSTTAAFVVAGAGIHVAKHGNRSVTSKSGSADVLESLGLNLNLPPRKVEEAIEREGIGFMFAPGFHKAMKRVARPRQEMGIRTVFNVLGPLTNPAGANAQVLGVYDGGLVEPLSFTLRELGCQEAMVVHGLDGMDEISTVGKTKIAWLKDGDIEVSLVSPRELGVKRARIEEISGTSPDGNAEIAFNVLKGNYGKGDPRTEIVLVNAAAGVVVGGKADDLIHGKEVAWESIESGAAYEKLRRLIKFSGGSLSRLEELERKYG